MEEESVAVIRETSRTILNLKRRFKRDEEADNRRPVASFSITPQILQDIANRLKTKSPTTVTELHTLKNGLMDEPKGIEIVMNTHGTLRGLVKELTGNNVKKQLAAAGCFCNLGLADSKACAAVAKAAGTYLVTALGSLTTELAVSCAWALGNLAGSSPKASELLAAQGALAKLADLLLSPTEEIRDAAQYALLHFTRQVKDGLSTEHLSKIFTALSKSDNSLASCQLLFVLSCHKDFNNNNIPDEFLQKILMDLPISIKTHLTCQNICTKECKLSYEIRILANITICDRIYDIYFEYFSQIVEGFKMLLLKDDEVTKSVLWLLGNLYNFNSDSLFFDKILR